jgi:hypothetical protein
VFLAGPVLLWWWIHGDYERYVWIISGPSPYDNFGGGPFQLLMYLRLFWMGLLLTGVAVGLRIAYLRTR